MFSFQPALPRRAVLATALSAPLPALASAEEWARFKRRHVLSDGRVVDNGNGGISHSEGQAWTMLLAVRFRDRHTFERVAAWTALTLGRRGDALLSWKFEPDAAGGRVTDRNNATDADLYHAWALAEAEVAWPGNGWAARSRQVASDILLLLQRSWAGETVLLPGLDGFEQRDALLMNPSYLVIQAYRRLDAMAPNPAWRRLRASALRLLDIGRFGRWSLPPDWWEFGRDGRLRPATGRPVRFGFDAVRVPLNLVWGGQADHPAIESARRFWEAHSDPPPAWVDLPTGMVAPFAGGIGHRAIRGLVLPTGAEASAGGGRYYEDALALLAGALRTELGIV